MKRLFLKISIILAAFAVGDNLNAQDDLGYNDEKLNLSLDVASSFVWRGLSLNSSPVVQPAITFTPGRFSFGAWASTAFTPGEFQEFDLFINFQITPSLSIEFINYFEREYSFWGYDSYFNYKKEETAHTFDLQLIYEGAGGLKAIVSTIIAGNDLNYDPKSMKYKNNFSTYLELGYANTDGKIDWEIFMGFVPNAQSDYYGIDGAAFINLGLGVSKNFEITPTYSLPLSLKLSVNPAYEQVFLVASIALF